MSGNEGGASVLRLAARWAAALLATSYVPFSRAETEEFLAQYLERLIAALHVTPFSADQGRAVGLGLVDAHFTSPQALSQTIEVLSSVPGSAGVGEDDRQRWAQLLGAVADSFTASLVDRVRREQQEILEAAFTARDEAERALRNTERQLERAREDFITTVSHELKTPLTPIKGYLHMLRNRDESMTAEQRQRCYAVMIDQAELLAGLVQDLLGAAELQHVGFSVRMRPVEVRPVIEKALQSVSPEAQHRFVLHVDGELGLAQCDPVRLQQVITNLLSNAEKYSPADQPVHLTATREGGAVEIAVRDYGPGVPPELADAVFDPFRRLGNSPKRGAGLGLHIARRLIEAMGGKIWLDSASGQGALFRLTVVAVRGDEPAAGEDVAGQVLM